MIHKGLQASSFIAQQYSAMICTYTGWESHPLRAEALPCGHLMAVVIVGATCLIDCCTGWQRALPLTQHLAGDPHALQVACQDLIGLADITHTNNGWTVECHKLNGSSTSCSCNDSFPYIVSPLHLILSMDQPAQSNHPWRVANPSRISLYSTYFDSAKRAHTLAQ